MGGVSTRLRGLKRLRARRGTPILFHMEVFSTPPRTLLPWAANGLTLVALVATTWWSAGQRPLQAPAVPNHLVTAPAAPISQVQSKQHAQAKLLNVMSAPRNPGAAAWPVHAPLPDAVQPVSYMPAISSR